MALGNSRGVALLLVLWLVALLAAVVGAFALMARMEAMQGKVFSSSAEVREIARAGIEYGIVRVQDSDGRTHWMADGRPYRWQFADGNLEIRIVDEIGKVDLNDSDLEMLSALIRVVGETDSGTADRLAGAIVDWRDQDSLTPPNGGAEDADYLSAGRPYGAKDAPFESVAELQQVLGFAPELYARLEPYLTLYAGRSRPDPRYAQAPVLTALGLDAQAIIREREKPAGGGDAIQFADMGSGTYSIESRARLGDGRQGVLRMTVNTRPRVPVPGSVYDILRLEEGPTH
ncbi:MAG: general secretion pathway protein GspK [Xanthomonadaceae bacterium]|nr:general secretion pathway protein GspK [Xanthomonadaceae bacterium]